MPLCLIMPPCLGCTLGAGVGVAVAVAVGVATTAVAVAPEAVVGVGGAGLGVDVAVAVGGTGVAVGSGEPQAAMASRPKAQRIPKTKVGWNHPVRKPMTNLLHLTCPVNDWARVFTAGYGRGSVHNYATQTIAFGYDNQ